MATKTKRMEFSSINSKKITTTPKCECTYPFIFRPSDYEGNKRYKINVILEGKEASELIKKISSAQSKCFKEAQQKTKAVAARKKLKKADPPYEPEYDAKENETGRTIFKFSCSAGGTRKDGTEWETKIAVVDAKAKPITVNPNMGNGSVVKVAYSLNPWLVKTDVGVSLKLEGVQLLELVEYSGAKSVTELGFTSEEGFEVDSDDDLWEDGDDDEDFDDEDDDGNLEESQDEEEETEEDF